MIRTQTELNQLVQYALGHMALLKSRGLWGRLEVTQFNVPHVSLVVGPLNYKGEKEVELGSYVYYMSAIGPTYRTNFGG